MVIRERREIVVVGSGFAATVLARTLARRGRDVLVVERGSHPRFALGESSTPLAAIALERLARGYDLPDLAALGAWGRLRRRLPGLRRGLKRGFTFWWHRPGEPWEPGAANRRRLLVAASPDDAIADVHWMRSDVDHHLVRRAEAEGVEVRQRTHLVEATETADGVDLHGFELTAEGAGRPVRLSAAFVVDATGPGGFLARALGLDARPRTAWSPPDGTLIYAHFDGARPLAEIAAAAGTRLEPGPYPDERAAVHHLLAGGWFYGLRFDAEGTGPGRLSAGAVLDPGGAAADLARLATADPAAAWRGLLDRYPTLAAQLAAAEPVRPIATVAGLRHRLRRAAGDRWALLPHAFAFFDPMFSTGIAWSLVAVERLARVLGDGVSEDGIASGDRHGGPGLRRYGELLDREADHLERLIGAAWSAAADPAALTAVGFLYFAAASWCETRQRLFPEAEDWPWRGFLGADDPALAGPVAEAAERLSADGTEDATGFAARIAEAIEPRNVAGLADPDRRNLYPVDEEALVAAAGKLGLTREQARAALPRLRGAG